MITIQLIKNGEEEGLYEILDSCEFVYDEDKLKQAFKDAQKEDDPHLFLENLGICRIFIDSSIYI